MYKCHKIVVMTLRSKSVIIWKKHTALNFFLLFPVCVRNIQWDLNEDLRVDYISLNVTVYL